MNKKITFLFIVILLYISDLFSQCLTGTYTIGTTGANYPSFTSAVNALSSNGVCGPVIFKVNPGTYTEQITMNAIAGVSATSTVTFESASGDSTSVILTNPSSASSTQNFTWELNAVRYLTIKGISIVRSGLQNYEVVLAMTGKCDSITLSHNVIQNYTTAAFSQPYCLVTEVGPGNTAIIYYQNRFQGGYNAIYNSTSGSKSTWITGNLFMGQREAAVYLQHESLLIVNNNIFHPLQSGNGIYLQYGQGNITCNKILGYTTRGIELDSDTSSLVTNNFLVGIGEAFYMGNSKGVSFLYNSVLDTTNVDAALTIYNSDRTEILNNILYCPQRSAEFYFQTGTTNTHSDHNDLKTSNTYFAGDVSGSYYSLNNWQTATKRDSNSVNAIPPYVSTSDLHIKWDNFLYGHGTPCLVTTDIDGHPRSTSKPCIGAHEFSIPSLDTRIASIDSVSAIHCNAVYTIPVTIYNGGSTTLTSAKINWSVNKILQPTFSWTGNLVSGNALSHINIGTYSFVHNTIDTIRVWTSNPNGSSDQIPANDSSMIIYKVNGMQGTYTIGGSTPDFDSLDAAVRNMNSRGICGPVVFNIRPGTYQFMSPLRHVPGATSVNTITFQAENGDSTSVTLNDFTWNTSNYYVISLIRGDYYTFRFLTLNMRGSSTSGTTEAHIIKLDTGSSNNSFLNCIIQAGSPGSNDPYSDLVYLSGGGCNNTLFQQNIFINGITGPGSYSAIGDFNASSSNVLPMNKGLQIRKNQFCGFGDADVLSINLSYCSKDTIAGNNFSTGGAIRIINSDSTAICGNYLKNFEAYQTIQNIYLSANESKVYNNFIYGTSTVLGKGNYFVHNSIHDTSSVNSEPILMIDSTTVIKNNLFYAYQENIYWINHGTAPFKYSDYNVVEDPYFNSAYYDLQGTGEITLAIWKTTSGFDQHSADLVIPYITNGDLHLYQTPTYQFQTALSFPFCTVDIDGDKRNMTSPAAGADEFVPPSGKFDAAMAGSAMGAIVCYGNQPVKIKFANKENYTSLNHILIGWSVNGAAQPTYTWTGLLPPHDTSSVITIGNYFFNTGNNNLKVWVSSPNGLPDPVLNNDSLIVNTPVASPVHLGKDTTICQGNSLTINAGNFSSYLWSTGSSNQQITVSSSGQYSVKVTDTHGCVSSNTIGVTVPFVTLGNDTSLCTYDSLLLNGGGNFASYIWSTGATSQKIWGHAGHSYWVKGAGANSCTSMDTIHIGTKSTPVVNLGHDTTICSNKTIILNAGSGYTTYNWSDGNHSSSATEVGGMYGIPNKVWVTVINSSGCKASDSIKLFAKTVAITVSGCGGSGVTLQGAAGYTAYQWSGISTGFVGTGQAVHVTSLDTYKLIAIDASGCGAAGEVVVSSFSPPASANFTHSASGFLVNFTCPSNGNTYSWSFGDGGTSTLQNPSHTYAAGTYTVALTVSNACGSISSLQVITVSSTGIIAYSEVTSVELNIYPNPSTGIYSIYLTSPVFVEGSLMKIYNSLGEIIYEKNLGNLNGSSTFDLDLYNYPNGIYLLQVEAGTSFICKKLSLLR
jgi:PKD repeat protein